jgi:hypothetical protein
MPRQSAPLDRRLVYDKHLHYLSIEAAGLLIFLECLSDPQGLSLYSDPRICKELDWNFNNLVENAIRPTAVEKKNGLFTGGPEAGERSEIIYTLLENCTRLGIPPHVYLHDVLSRLPGMMNDQTHELTPAKCLEAQTEAPANAA